MKIVLNMAVIAFLIAPEVSMAGDFGQGPKIVPASIVPNEKEMIYEEQILPFAMKNEARIFIENDSGANYYKRLYLPKLNSEIRVEPDHAALLDPLIKCVNIKDFPSTSYKNISIQLDNKTGLVIARYPLEYKCSFDQAKIESLIREDAQLTERSRASMISTNPGQCDGKEMKSYVEFTIAAGQGVLSVAKQYGTGTAFGSSTMGSYYQGTDYIRRHDLALTRQGCKSLKYGPSDSQLAELRQVVSEIEHLAAQEASKSGIITGPYGILPSK